MTPHDNLWPKPRLVLIITRVSSDIEGMGVELPPQAFKKLFQRLYWETPRDDALIDMMKRVWGSYLEQMRAFLIQRSFGLYARVPWSILGTQKATRELRSQIFGGGNDDRTMRGLFGYLTTETGPILQTDAVLEGLGDPQKGRDQHESLRMAGSQRTAPRTGRARTRKR